MRALTVLVLCGAEAVSGTISLFVSGVVSLSITSVWAYALAVISLAYWLARTPDLSGSSRPLGVMIIAVANFLAGLAAIVEGILILFLPVYGIIGVALLGLGAFSIWLAKGMWRENENAWLAAQVLAVIGIIASSLLGLFIGVGTAFAFGINAVYQLWYLRRPHVSDYFSGSTRLILPLGHCQVCGADAPKNANQCLRCGMEIPILRENLPAVLELTNLPLLRDILSRSQETLDKLDQVRRDHRVMNSELFEKTYAAKTTEVARLKGRVMTLEQQVPT